MINGTRTHAIAKGAFVVFSEPFRWHIPNIIVFQYNPETLERSLSIPLAEGDKLGSDPLAMKSPPVERFQGVNIEIDATDQPGYPHMRPLSVLHGIGPQLAALESLAYPVREQIAGNAATGQRISQYQAPPALFVWEPTRLLPVRVTELSIAEEAFDPVLNPIQATVTLSMEVLNDEALRHLRTPVAEVVRGAYRYTRGARETMARANLVNSTEYQLNGVLRMIL